MSHLYRATKAYQEQLKRDAQLDEAGNEVEPGEPRLTGSQLIKTLRALQRAKAARERRSAPPAWMQT
jgi:hypothetical protein